LPRTEGMRPIGTSQELERRRRRAVELVKQGESPKDVAHFLGCGRSSVYTWLKLDRERPQALAAKLHPGRTPRLNPEQLAELEGLLLQGAKAHGWRTHLWTADRVAALIERHLGVHFHPEHVRKVVKRKLGWTSQKPQRKAKERDEVAIAH
jgi:transposase